MLRLTSSGWGSAAGPGAGTNRSFLTRVSSRTFGILMSVSGTAKSPQQLFGWAWTVVKRRASFWKNGATASAEDRRVQHLAEAVHLEHDHPEPCERLVGRGEDIAVLRALDVHLEQQVALDVVVGDPVLEADVVLARARRRATSSGTSASRASAAS